ncbi:glycosyltransferase family 4 protein [Nostoc sp.]|uniref:glycosyltransferase family 4 protein n=1 Tax=Nostoc sp. TaxID=1180 RepID=UPI002FFAA9D8
MNVEKPKSATPDSLHVWFPNLFEFRGGIQVYLQDVLQAIQEALPNLSVCILDKLDTNKPIDKFNSKKYSFTFSGHFPGFLKTAHFTFKLITKALTNHPKFILCGHINFTPIAFFIHWLTGIPYVIIVYGIDAWNIKNVWKIKALYAADKIISISSYTRDRLINEHNLSPDKIELLPVTFDAERFKVSPKPNYLLERYGLKSNQPVILTVTRLSSGDGYKGYDQIIQALPEIKRYIPDAHYILAGKGDDQPRIEQLIAQLNLQDSVTLAGFVPDRELCDHYNLCDVFAMPSRGEGFGIVYLEALACGKPTVGGNQDGAIDALCHGELGALVDPLDVDAIAQTLIQILQRTYPHPLMYQPETLRQRVIDTFGFARFQQTLTELINNSLIES